MDDDNDLERLTLEMIERFGTDAVHVARELDEITDALPDISCTALKAVERFGNVAVYIVREMVDIMDELGDMRSVEAWRDIADAIDRLQLKS
jgi:hypothetical protein